VKTDSFNIDSRPSWSDFLRGIFPFKVQKISINGGFTCPNRDGTKGWGGCTYCNNQTFSPAYTLSAKPVAQQVEEGIRFFARKYPEMKYLAYFQSYTNTYDRVENLLEKYYEALNHPEVVGLILATRPDCVSGELLDALEKIARQHFLLIEYGIESTDEGTLQHINRGHTYTEAVEAVRQTAERNIYAGAHIILGLPGESTETILSHADHLSELPLTTVKLHQLQLIKGTVMAQQWEAHPEQFYLYSVDEYIDLCLNFHRRLNPAFIIERFVSQAPKELLLAPDWGLKNYEFTERLRKAEINII
jgi:radical SAM protein (TIGR01212 family)